MIYELFGNSEILKKDALPIIHEPITFQGFLNGASFGFKALAKVQYTKAKQDMFRRFDRDE